VPVVCTGTETKGSSSRSSTERREASKLKDHQPFFTEQHKEKGKKKTV